MTNETDFLTRLRETFADLQAKTTTSILNEGCRRVPAMVLICEHAGGTRMKFLSWKRREVIAQRETSHELEGDGSFLSDLQDFCKEQKSLGAVVAESSPFQFYDGEEIMAYLIIQEFVILRTFRSDVVLKRKHFAPLLRRMLAVEQEELGGARAEAQDEIGKIRQDLCRTEGWSQKRQRSIRKALKSA